MASMTIHLEASHAATPDFGMLGFGACTSPSVAPATLRWYFSNSDLNWVPSNRSTFINSIAAWSRLRTTSGSPMINLVEQTAEQHSSDAFEVRLSLTASTDCVNRIIRVRQNAIAWTGTHEVGHALGLVHTGRYDLLMDAGGIRANPAAPLMSGCFGPLNSDHVPSVDDAAAAFARWNHSVLSDWGYESLAGARGFHRSGTTTRESNGAYAGTWRMNLGSQGQVQQQVRVTDPSRFLDYNTRYKTLNTTGGAFKALYRTVGYPRNGNCGGFRHSTWSYDAPSPGNWVTSAADTLSATNTWQYWQHQPIATSLCVNLR